MNGSKEKVVVIERRRGNVEVGGVCGKERIRDGDVVNNRHVSKGFA